jgi:pimeloyl-ACP methyl ester carboxylesterase
MSIPHPSPPLPSTRNIAWIAIASLLAAVLLSIVLVMVAVAGARENVISATVIFAFAAGAVLLAVLSAERSDQPQRWALIAAGWLTLAGTVLLVWPGVVSTAAIAWVAPALLLALVVWMTLRVRRALNSRIRPWLVYPVFLVVAGAAIGGVYETVQETLDRGAHRMRGQLVGVGGGRRMYLSCAGSGSPTVVLVPGAGELSSIWGWIAPDVARGTRVCVYDRAGRGWSDPAPSQQDGMAIATDLATLLTSAHEAPPYVLVGHSFGGLYVRAFAARYPSRTAGVVLLDATDPQMFTRLPSYPTFYEGFRRVSALFPSLARFGVGRLAYGSQYDGLPREARAEERMFWFTARQARSLRDEWATAPLAMQQADSLVTLGDRPLMVVTALQDAQEGWAALQDEVPKLSSNSSHWSLSTTSHASLIEDQADAALASQAIREVVTAVRTSKPLARH